VADPRGTGRSGRQLQSHEISVGGCGTIDSSAETLGLTVHRLLHRRTSANQQMRWSPRGAHLMLKVRTAVVNGTFNKDHTTAERWARRPFRHAA
jgi:hypothetical protein